MSAHPFGVSRSEMRERAVSQMLDFYEIIQVCGIERCASQTYEAMLAEDPKGFSADQRIKLEEHRKLQSETAELIVAQAMILKGNGALDLCYVALRDAS